MKECGEWLGDPHRGGWKVVGGAHKQAVPPALQTVKRTSK